MSSNVAGKDDNGAPVIFGVSHVDGKTPVQIVFGSSRQMLMDDTTTIEFNPTVNVRQNPLNEFPFAKATSIADNKTVLPWVVNANTGAVIVEVI